MRVKLKHRRLAAELARSPLSLNRWALKMGLSSGHLSELANGKRIYLRPETRAKLLEALSLDFDDLFEIEMTARRRRLQTPSSPNRLRRFGPSTPRPEAGLKPHQGDAWMQRFSQNLRFAFRQIGRRPGFAIVAILTLAIGIGSNTALFSLVDTVLWKPYPYHDPSALVRIYSTNLRSPRSSLSFEDYWDYRQQNESFVDMAAHDWEPYALSGGDEPIRIGGGRVTASLFSVLGVEPLRGRTFTEEEDRPGGPRVVVLGEKIWRSYFGSEESVVGRDIHLNDEPHKVIGIMPHEAEYPDRANFWVPLRAEPTPSRRGSRWLQVTGRLESDVDVATARTQLSLIARRLEEAFPESNHDRGVNVLGLKDGDIGPFRVIFLALLGLVGFVLLIVCGNVANLLLARSLAREREMAIRAALGANRGTVVRQLLTESMVLAVAGGILGFLMGYWGVHRMTALIPIEIPAWIQFELDGTLVGYTLLLTILSSFIFGLLPALQSSRGRLVGSLRDGGRSSSGLSRRRHQRSLAVAQVALSVVVLVCAGLVVRSVLELSAVNPGFAIENRLTVGMDMLAHLGKSKEERVAIFEGFQEKLSRIPGVMALGAIDRLPLKGSDNNSSMSVEGQTEDEYRGNPVPILSRINTSYFEAMGIPILQGGSWAERLTEGERPIVLSEKAAQGFWPGENAVGKRIKFGGPSSESSWLQVTGVVGDVHHIGIDRETRPTVYVPYQILPLGRMTWVFKTAPEAVTMTSQIRQAVFDSDSRQPLHEIMPLREVVDQSYWQWDFFGTIFKLFAVVGLTLACIGLYGVMACFVAERTQEIGVRMALGARRNEVVGLIFGQGFRLVFIGLVIGLPIAVAVGQLVSSALFRGQDCDGPTFASVTAILVAVALVAVTLPARRASRVDPIVALRYE